MPNFGGQFINWDQYLSGNQPGAQSMANGLYDQISGQAAGAQAGIASAEGEFAQQAGQGGQGAAYHGPTSIAFSDPLRRQVGNANQALSAAAGGTYGIQALMQQKNAGSGYTQGMGLYDAALTGSAAGSRFQGLRGQYAGLTGGLEAAQGRAGTLVDQIRARGPNKGPVRTDGGPIKIPLRQRVPEHERDPWQDWWTRTHGHGTAPEFP